MYASVSVIIPCYRCSETIARAVKSVAEQTLLPEEIILVDDHSGDSTLDTLQKIQNNYQPGWIKIAELTTNSGPAIARNTGWDLAKSQYLAFLDADDTWHPEKIAIQYTWMQQNQAIALSGHQVIIRNNNHTNFVYASVPTKINFQNIDRNRILFSNSFCTSSVMLKREIKQRFNPHFRYSEDYLLWLEIILSGRTAIIINFPLCYYFKPPFGAGGQTKNLFNFKITEQQIYHRLLETKEINFFEWYFLSLWSLAKYYRRVLICKLRK